jgi:hypothetical protein
MRVGDIIIPKVTMVATCGDIIFMAERKYYIGSIINVGHIDTYWIDSELGDWVLFEHDIASKFTHISLRSMKINDILNDGHS